MLNRSIYLKIHCFGGGAELFLKGGPSESIECSPFLAHDNQQGKYSN